LRFHAGGGVYPIIERLVIDIYPSKRAIPNEIVAGKLKISPSGPKREHYLLALVSLTDRFFYVHFENYNIL
jgi:hypothetical protein